MTATKEIDALKSDLFAARQAVLTEGQARDLFRDQRDEAVKALLHAESALARAREVLREVEWIPLGGSSDDLISICPKCRRFYLVGHFQGCALKAALEG